ncbi:hypothetical protein IKF33_02095 [Candidatus Saccharibacteria bacterium]|nr:hypothetical protein [Candidatus Saccharibacteria bacterium]
MKNIDNYLRRTGLKGMATIVIAALLFLAAAFVFGCAIKYVCTNHEISRDYGDLYEKTVLNASCVKIIDDCPNVRSEPIAAAASPESNSFGTTKECNFTLEVSKVYTMDKSLDTNGKYIGLKVSDILDTAEGKSWFPEKIKDDPDGIVWINENYIKLL